MIYIGVDESGTGSWAGGYTVCAVATRAQDAEALCFTGVRDSKKLTDAARRALVDTIVSAALGVHYSIVGVDDINSKRYDAWRQAMINSVRKLAVKLGFPGLKEDIKIIVDGNYDRIIHGALKAVGTVEFVPRADSAYIAVAAASILAKTVRNNMMIALDKKFPGYGWAKNAGYGTRDHRKAIKRLGLTPEHRDIKPLKDFIIRR